MTKLFQLGDTVTLESGESGLFVRMYGQKVQIRTESGKVTGIPKKADEKPAKKALKESKGRPTGTIQEKILQVLRDGTEENEEGEQTCEISYRELGIATGVNTPRAATCMKSLVGRGVVKKIKPGTGGKNHYQVVEK